MGAFEDFLKKQGYVKLDRYGLVLTPDDRILSTRPAVLDDGLGGKIVGWADGDLAAAELETWGAPARKAPAKPAASPLAAAKPVAANPGVQIAAPAPAPRPLPGVAPMATLPGMAPAAAPQAPARMPSATIPPPVPATQLAMIAAPMPAPVTKPSQVAEEPVVEEDEWEWEIAMARARAVADEVSAAAATVATSFTAPKTAAPKRTMPMAAVAAAAPSKPSSQFAKGSGPVAAAASSLAAASAASDAMSSWPATDVHESWEETRESPAPQVLSPAQKNLAVAKTAIRKTPVAVPLFEQPAPSRSTVIPVPQLPVAASPSEVRPAFKPGQPPPRLASKARIAAQPRSRLARGTDSPSEDTVVTAPVMPANDDRTSPYVTLPAEIKPAPGFAHNKQVAAKHR